MSAELAVLGLGCVAIGWLLGALRKSDRPVRPSAFVGSAASAEIAIADGGKHRVTLLATGEAARRSVLETAERLAALGEDPGLPRVVRLREGRRSVELVLEGDARPLGPALSPSTFEARRIAQTLLRVLDRLHAAGYVVGDLPPGSVCVRPEGGVLLLLLAPPWGVAPSFRASPEVSRGTPPDARDDVFSAAAVVVEMLTGLPFQSVTGSELERTLAARRVHPELRRVLGRALGPRDERPRTIGELRAALDAIPWRDGLAGELHARVRAIRSDHRLDVLDRRREETFLPRVRSPELGDLAVTLRSIDLLELAFAPARSAPFVEGAFVETSPGRVLGTVTRGRVPVSLSAIDLRDLAQNGLWLRTPSGEVHDLGSATVLPPPEEPPASSDLSDWLALVRGRTALALGSLATDALLAVLAVADEDGGPPVDVRTRIEDEVARRLLLRSDRLRPDSAEWEWLDRLLPDRDVARAVLFQRRQGLGDSTLEERATSHAKALDAIAREPGRLRGAAERACAWFAARGHAVLVLAARPPATGFVRATATWATILTDPHARRGDAPTPELARAIERAIELANGALGVEAAPRVAVLDPSCPARLVTVPLLVASVLARTERQPLPAQVALAAPLNADGRVEPLGPDLAGIVEAAIAAGVRLIFVPQADVEAAQRARTARGADARDLVVSGLPDVPLGELVEVVEQRVADHFPSQLVLDRDRARLVLEQAGKHVAAARPELALPSLAFLLRALAHPRTRALARLRARVLAESARSRNARGQWRLALEAFKQAEAELERLGTGRDLDWRTAELRFELPVERAACLLHAFAFDVAKDALEENLRTKRESPIVSRHSLALSHGTLGLLELEWGIAEGVGAARDERFERARRHLGAALDGIDAEERVRYLNGLGHLETLAGDLATAERRYADADLAIGSDAAPGNPRDREGAALGRVFLELRRGLAGDPAALDRAHRLGASALASPSRSGLFRGRVLRCMGAALLARGEVAGARAALLEGRGALGALGESSSFLADGLPDIELARVECLARREADARRWIASALGRLAAFRAQIVGMSAVAQGYVSGLERGLERARDALATPSAATVELDRLLERIPAF